MTIVKRIKNKLGFRISLTQVTPYKGRVKRMSRVVNNSMTWSPPQEHFIKVNIDATVVPKSRLVEV